jgi:hypothetical protein
MRQHRQTNFVIGIALAAVLALAPSPARADDAEAATGAGLGAAAMLCTLVYGPAKLIYATLGGITSGFAYALTGGSTEVAYPIFASSVYGDYIVKPANLSGDEPLEFVGREAGEPDVASGGEGIPEPVEEQF